MEYALRPDTAWKFAEYGVNVWDLDPQRAPMETARAAIDKTRSFFTSIGHPFPAVCIRTSTERPEALDKGCFVLAGIDEKGLLQAVVTAVDMDRNGDYGIPVPDYLDETVSTKVVKIIQSYTGVVDKFVWRK